ncbi:neutrophil cytosol factor 2 isoform X2 [Rhincodon typus]|uniref:neutrophil cytosol factor 2 isoform X2 n=1 Tax=Rhincodon typus TaxID=259920 RepID=UPI0009A2E3E6|nr:neutrophil cytosol factor 2 isoform X2 [Rhincodon typus]
MSLTDTIKLWDEGITAADRQEWLTALNLFTTILEPSSKICFNIGCLHLLRREWSQAEKAFDKSICKDEHLAVAFYQRGITLYKNEKYEEALRDFVEALNRLRGNQLIDYNQLGLRYKLCTCQVLHNVALAHATMQNWDKAEEALKKAITFKTEAKPNYVDQALESASKRELFQLLELPAGELFRPKRKIVAQLEKQDFLGEAKVVASIIDKDAFSGFAPLQPQAPDHTPEKKAPEKFKTLEGVPHRVLFNFLPSNKQELEVKCGNIVFVLKKGEDNWARVTFNNEIGLVPYNYLEPLEAEKGEKSPPADIPAPPTASAPERPAIVQDENVHTNTSQQVTESSKKNKDHSVPVPSIVKVHFKYTVAIRVKPGLSHNELLAVISKKFQIPEERLGLSYKSQDSGELIPITSEVKMKSAWTEVRNQRLTIWCKFLKVVALYDYEVSVPADLGFHEGDIIQVLAHVNNNWLEGQCNGNTGIFPANFVKELSMADMKNSGM